MLEKPTCLVVEENEDCCYITAVYCKELGFTVIQTDSAEEAMELCRCNNYDLFIIDWDLPVKSGIDFLWHLNKNNKLENSVVIFSTIYSSGDKQRLARTLGAKGFLTKPYSKSDFVKLVKEFF